MSRIGQLPIKMPEKTKATVDAAAQVIRFEGPKGKLTVKLPHPEIKPEIDPKTNILTVSRPTDSRRAKSLQGLTRAILANAAKGVSTGFERALAIRGVGFRAEVKGKSIHFS